MFGGRWPPSSTGTKMNLSVETAKTGYWLIPIEQQIQPTNSTSSAKGYRGAIWKIGFKPSAR